MRGATPFRAAILATLPEALPPAVIEPGHLHRFPTNGKRSDRAGWCHLYPDGRGGAFGCWRAVLTEHWSAEDPRTMTPAERAAHARAVMQTTAERERMQRAEWKKAAEANTAMRAAGAPLVEGDTAAAYLRHRGIRGPLPGVLRLHPGLPYWHDTGDGRHERIGTFPALVAPIVGDGGRLLALHRTYLHPAGRKADVPAVRKVTRAAGPLGGACIPLGEPDELGRIGIAEGIETALSARDLTGVPTCAAYSAGNLAAWQWPRAARAVVVFADNDGPEGTGTRAAERLRQRVRAAGLACTVLAPEAEGADWCDVQAAVVRRDGANAPAHELHREGVAA
jgi:phage/plasmid primase-like uncharacterized protein